MSLIVQKYGGTSVGSLERIQQVASQVINTRALGHEVVIIVSAMSGETDRLIHLAKSIQSDPDPREYAVLVSTGEQVSIALLTMALIARGCPARSYTGLKAGIQTDSDYKKARILGIDSALIREDLFAGRTPVIAGFQGISEQGEMTTLGRGGSDTTAVALAAALKADECQIYTDVEGIYTADPKIVPTAHRIDDITFKEMLELSGAGAKVLQQRAVEFAGQYQVPLRVLSSFKPGPGTLVRFDEMATEQGRVKSIASQVNEVRFTMDVDSSPAKVIAELFNVLSLRCIDTDVVIQRFNSELNKSHVSFTVGQEDYAKTKEILEVFKKEAHLQNVTEDVKIAKLSLIGLGLRSYPVIASTFLKTLLEQGVSVIDMAISEIKLTALIEINCLEKTARALHRVFGLED